MIRTALVAAALAACAATAAAEPVQTYTRTGAISSSEGLRTVREFLPAADPRLGDRLLNAAPFPAGRTDGPARLENGRLWFPRQQIGSRSILRELPLGFPGSAGFGAPPAANDDIIYVRSDTGLPVLAISPWVNIDQRTTDLIESEFPRIPNTGILTFQRSEQIRRELREAQNQWLREQGYIQKVRTHVNPKRIYGVNEGANAEDIRPIMRLRNPEEGEAPVNMQVSLPTDSDEVTRISTPSKPRPIIRVVRQAPEEETGAEQDTEVTASTE
ncbi:MAG: hypothetical protein AAFX05_13785 [Planctomycetota bacterium]